MTDSTVPAEDAIQAAFDAWWPRHAVRHNSRSPKAAREAFDAGWQAAAERTDALVKQARVNAYEVGRAAGRDQAIELATEVDARYDETIGDDLQDSPFANLLRGAESDGEPFSDPERPQTRPGHAQASTGGSGDAQAPPSASNPDERTDRD